MGEDDKRRRTCRDGHSRHLSRSWNYEDAFSDRGSSELQGAECAACRALTDKAQEADIEQVIDDATSETVDVVREYYRIFLNLIAEKNPEVFEEIRRGAACQWHAFSADRNGV